MPELLPCPFCGEKEHIYRAYHGLAGGEPYAIDCLGCGADYIPRKGRDVVAMWNRRSPSPAGVTEAAVDDDSLRILWQFADMYRSGEQGAQMDFGAAQALALSIDDALDVLARLAAIPLLSPSMGWQQIDIAPHDRRVLVTCMAPHLHFEKLRGWITVDQWEHGCFGQFNAEFYPATHWRELPLPPANGEGQ